MIVLKLSMAMNRLEGSCCLYNWNKTFFKTPFSGCRLREKGRKEGGKAHKKEGREEGRSKEKRKKEGEGEWREKKGEKE